MRVSRVAGRLLAVCLAGGVLLSAPRVFAQAAPPAGHEDTAFDFMNVLSHAGLHDIEHESWNAYGQFTYISTWHTAFPAGYTNLNGTPFSLSPTSEQSFTMTATLFLGVGLWPGAEAYLVPEVISETAFSGLHGIGGDIQNFELQKTGSVSPQLYRSRMYLRQTIGLGGDPVVKTSDPMQLASVVDARRLVLTAGNFTILDVFDRSEIAPDPRRDFLNMAFMTYTSWDFPADARGYSYGGTLELYWDDWALRYGRIAPPQNPNQLQIDFNLFTYYGDQVEIEHDHKLLGQDGSVRVVGYRDELDAGRFSDAIAAYQGDPRKNATTCPGFNYGSSNAHAPDLCWARRANAKLGIGVHVEQHITRDVGVFVRAMYSDGQVEVDAFNSADRSAAIGLITEGDAWRRPFDIAGIGTGLSWISQVHAQYLAMGGVDGFIGDGAIHQAAEGVAEAFYSVNMLRALWFTGDYQFLWNPAFNADRGPVHVFGVRAHAEF
jgi:hypothetical protein